MLELNKLYLMDCQEGMAQFPDGYFALAIVDPPYGVTDLKGNDVMAGKRLDKYGDPYGANMLKPGPEYFKELFRVSKHQIVFGYNHLSDMLPAAKEFIFWYKRQPAPSFADGELAWTSFSGNAKCFDYAYYASIGMDKDMKRQHPMQKPIPLYNWILRTYEKQIGGGVVLDTHVGSASSLVACYQAGVDYVGFEINPVFYEAAQERLEAHMNQMRFV